MLRIKRLLMARATLLGMLSLYQGDAAWTARVERAAARIGARIALERIDVTGDDRARLMEKVRMDWTRV